VACPKAVPSKVITAEECSGFLRPDDALGSALNGLPLARHYLAADPKNESATICGSIEAYFRRNIHDRIRYRAAPLLPQPRCRSKLPKPIANPREAFCTRGCHGSFYLRRCLVCEGPLDRKR
jgi:hypothetical protein